MLRKLSLVALVATSALTAQDLPVYAAETGVIAANPVPAPGPDVPPPPKNLLASPPKHGMPEVPVGYSTILPPDSPPSIGVGELEDVGGDYRVFRNPNVKPSGASTSNVCEPDAILADVNNGFYTHNWSAARTTDSGANWTRVNPYTRFPASFGGFCCDQVLTRAPNGAAAWLLQYVKDATGNTQRIAIADNATEVGTDAWSRYYDFRASSFGFASTDWLDYPDAAATNEYFYFTSNVFNQANGFTGAVIWRFRIADAVAGGSLPFSFISSPGGSRGASFRLTQGATGDMWIGSHASTSQLRVIRYNNAANNFNQVERNIAAWVSGSSPAPGPDGRDWTGRGDNRITGGYANASQFGFVWHVNATTNRPFNYLKRVAFNVSDLQVSNERDIWATSVAFKYPAAATNAWGHVGIVCAFGGGGSFPSACTLLEDDLEGFSFFRTFASGSAGPTSNVWGDYLAADRHPQVQQYGTFIGTGFRTGGDNSTVTPEFVHFGREAFGPDFVGLIVRATPVNVAITSTPDAFAQGGATTPYYRAFATSATYTVTAPARAPGHLFLQWATKSVAEVDFALQPVGQTSFTIGIGSIDDLTEARYVPERILTVNSTDPASGVAIQVAPNDFDGLGNGTTSFSRAYRDGESVTLTAPATSGCNRFARWVVNGSARTGNPITITMDGPITAVAQYQVATIGSVRALGAGCPGSNRFVPTQLVTHRNGVCGPTQGTPTTYTLANARPNTVGVMHIGSRTDFLGSIRLPWNFGPFGAPLCNLRHDIIVSPDVTTSSSGIARLDITWPIDRAFVGTPFHTTFVVIDLPANALGVVLSDAVSTSQGGFR